MELRPEVTWGRSRPGGASRAWRPTSRPWCSTTTSLGKPGVMRRTWISPPWTTPTAWSAMWLGSPSATWTKRWSRPGSTWATFSSSSRRARTRTSGTTTVNLTVTWPSWRRLAAFFLDFAALGGTSTRCGLTTPRSWTCLPPWTTSMTWASCKKLQWFRIVWTDVSGRLPGSQMIVMGRRINRPTSLSSTTFRSTLTTWTTSSPTAMRSHRMRMTLRHMRHLWPTRMRRPGTATCSRQGAQIQPRPGKRP